ncbi:MAG TPA: EamA family transporter [Bacillota bacterium]|nr:EamA family transporter [Bacillota bacterium]
MWFLFTILAALSWGGANLFYKKGSNPDDKLSHLKIVVMVGAVMGVHAITYMIVKDIAFDPFDIIRYLPVSFLYILSMTLGFVGLRYIELSISAPVQNSAGAITAILLYIFFPRELSILDITGIVVITVGVFGLAVMEKRAQDEALKLADEIIDPKYQLSFLAIIFPILYALIDGLGSFADGVYLDELKLIGEESALIAYELTFLFCAILAYLYIKIVKKESFAIFKERDRAYAAILETTGQFFYVFAMAANALIAAPIIAAHGIFSVLLSRIFLKEILSREQYIMITLVMAGIVALGIAENL